MQNNPPLNSTVRARLAGGLGPWLAGHTPLMAFGHLVLEAGFQFLPVVYVLLIPKLGLTYSQIGALALMSSVAGTLTQPVFGWLSDRGDPRVIVIGGLAWGGTLMGLVGFMPSYPALAVLLVLAALGSAAFHPPAAALSAMSGAGNRGRAMSLFSVGGSLGSALSPALVGVALGTLGLASTAVVIPLSLVTAALLTYRLRGLRPPRALDDGEGAGAEHRVIKGSFAALAAAILIVGSRSFFQLGLSTYLPEWLRGDGQTLAMAGAALALYMVAISVGSLLGGWLSDRIGRLPVVGFSLVLMMAGHVLLMRLTGLPQMGAVLLLGLMIGATYPVTIVMAQESWPRSVGFASAMVMGVGWLPAGLGAWAVGAIADRSTLTAGLQSLLLVPLVGLGGMVAYALLTRKKLTTD